ncbi:MAG TPA: TonB-dependent receptor [Flavobacteriales bacterium]
MRGRACILWMSIAVTSAQAQDGFGVSGTVMDQADRSVLPGAAVVLIDAIDTLQRRNAVSDLDGVFRFTSVPAGRYRLRSTFVGYARLDRALEVTGSLSGLELLLASATTELKAFDNVALMQRAEQKGDTTIFNAAAFKVNPDATAEDLVTKMPGITNDGGTIKAQGEAVKRVLVDGEEFFGDDAALTLKNLPAEIIDKVQVFDRQSDQAQFSGFDTGDREKTINITTKSGRNQGVFGKASLGYGTDERYAAGLMVNWFRGTERISLIGQTNNINQQNFSMQDLVSASSGSGGSGGGGRRGGGGARDLLVGNQPGINTTTAIGLNYSNRFGKNTKLSGGYFFNQQNSLNTNLSERTTFLSDTAAQYSNSTSDRSSVNYNHRFNFRLEHAFDSANSIVLTPRLSFQRNNSNALSTSRVTNEEGLQLSATDNDNRTSRDGVDFTNSLLFRHKFARRGRTISANLTTSFNGQNSTGRLLAENAYLTDTLSATDLDQRSSGDNLTQRHAVEVEYTEPISQRGQLRLSVTPSTQISSAEKLTYDIDPDSGGELLNERLSNQADNTINTLRGGATYQYKKDKLSFNLGLDAMGTAMHSDQTYPFRVKVDKDFANLLPGAMLMYRPDKNTRLRFNYRTNTRTPSITQLQTVVDNSDPLKLTTGDLSLGQGYQHSLSLNFNTIDSSKTRPFFAMLMVQTEQDRISNVTYAPAVDSTLADGTVLAAGSQLTKPMNLDGYLSARFFSNYGLPLTALKSNLNLNGGGSVERLPGAVNEAISFTWNTNWNLGAVVGSNISKGVDFRVGYTANFNTARSELRPSLNNDYYQGALTGKLTLSGWKGWVLENEVNYNQYVGLGSDYDQDALVWNAALAHKFLKGDALELRLTAYDILKRNVSVTRDVSDTYIQSTVTNMLQQYFMLTVSFNLRAFKGVAEEKIELPPGMPRTGDGRPMMPPPGHGPHD